MRKQALGPASKTRHASGPRWLDLEQSARVELSSEDPDHPIESVFAFGESSGWRASRPGQQTIRVIFSEPQRVTRIRVRFVEATTPRTQEFTICWVHDAETSSREIVRQRWNFSPDGSTTEIEDYAVDLTGVVVLELTIDPDLGRNLTAATLAEWRVA
jgi:hypothetical protein